MDIDADIYNNTQTILNDKFGFKNKIIFNHKFTETFQYLHNKYNLDKYEQIILYYILNTKYPNFTKKKPFHLLISMYNEKKNTRAMELLLCLSKNVRNLNISHIHIIYEIKEGEIYENLITETIYALQNKLKIPNIIITHIGCRPSFDYLFNYCNTNIFGKVILSNTDIVYDNTLKKIENIDEDTMLCISRKNKKQSDSSVIWEIIKLDLPPAYDQKINNTFSHDTWVFSSPMKYAIGININLGEMFCDSYLNYKLQSTPYKCYNLAKDINCKHIQEEDSFSKIVSKDKILSKTLLQKLYKKENGYKDCIVSLKINNIINFYENQNYNMFFNHSTFLELFVNPTKKM